MSLTLGLTGMDPATEAALKAAFNDANARLGGTWRLLPEADAEHVVVDMDSMYGPMSWLRLHAAGRHVIGLTSAPRTQTDFRLGRPFDGDQVAQLLVDVARSIGVESTPAPAATSAPAPAEAPAPAIAAEAAPAQRPEPLQPEPESADVASVDAPVAIPDAAPSVEAAAPAPTAAPSATATATAAAEAIEGIETTGTGAEAEAEEPAAIVEPVAPLAPQVRTLAVWLQPGALRGRVRYRSASGPTLYIDSTADSWHGPTPLKPLAGYFEGALEAEDFAPVDDATWAREVAGAGTQQPLARLRWLGGLLAGGGALLGGQDPDGRYVLTKWPQTEREYPRHFRIATAMMKGPATVAEIAVASSIPEADVADFINANLATGYAEAVVEPPPVLEEPVKPRAGGLLGRLRNR